MDYSISFADMLGAMSQTEAGWTTSVPQSWRQGRTCYGGLTTGLAYGAAIATFSDLPPLRSVLVNFTGPVGEAPVFNATVLRQGKSLTTINVDVFSDGTLGARVVFSFGKARESVISKTLPITPPAKPLEKLKRFTPKLAERIVPNFFLHFETRLIDGHRPMAGKGDGYIYAASRFKDEPSRAGMASLLALADVLPPAALPMVRKFGAVSSVNWMINILTDDISTRDGWWLVETKLSSGGAGYSSQPMNVWDAKGRPVIEALQNVALFI